MCNAIVVLKDQEKASDAEGRGAGRATCRQGWWFRALDQRPLVVGAQRWLALVMGIHAHGRDLWIQLAHASDLDQSLVLHVPPGVTLEHATAAAAAAGPCGPEGPYPHVVFVATAETDSATASGTTAGRVRAPVRKPRLSCNVAAAVRDLSRRMPRGRPS